MLWTYPVASKGTTKMEAVADCVAEVDAQVYREVSRMTLLSEYLERTLTWHGYDEVDVHVKYSRVTAID